MADRTRFVIQKEPIVGNPLLEPKTHEGALVLFLGLVRDFNKEKSGVTVIEYQSYEEMAVREGLKILEHAVQKFEVSRIYCVHRVGRLVLQDIAIHLEVRSSHRGPSFHACEYVMDKIKEHVPMWKKEFYGEESEWL